MQRALSISAFHRVTLYIAAFGTLVAGELYVGAPAGAQMQPESNWCEGAAPQLQIEGCTTIIKLELLPQKYLAFAYNNRGIAYDEMKDFDAAILDFTTAVRLSPQYAAAYDNRGNVFNAKGDLAGAIADYTKAIALDTQKASVYRHRGLAYFYSGDHAKALADLNQANIFDPKDAYSALWLDIVGARDKIASRLAQAVTRIDMKAWPAPVIRMYESQETPAALRAAADNADTAKQTGQVCEANFYSGEWALRQSKNDDAVRLFRLAARNCPIDFDEWSAANNELKALNTTP